MKKTPPPSIILGSWIWHEQNSAAQSHHVLFRRDFVLDSIPGTCELQLAARCVCQIFINGHFFAFAPLPHPTAQTYIIRHDISHLMEIGINSIAIHAFCNNSATTSRAKLAPALWIQLIGDDVPIIWTDNSWYACTPDCYAMSELNASPAEANIEILNYNQFPRRWLTIPQYPFQNNANRLEKDVQWESVNRVTPIKDMKILMEPSPFSTRIFEPRVAKEILFRGIVMQKNEVLWISFSEIYMQKRQPGLYAAEAYVKCYAKEVQPLFCFSNTPFKMFVNDVLVTEQHVPATQHRYSFPQFQNPETVRMDNTQTVVEPTFQKGWNKITIVKWCDVPHAGMTIIFGELNAGDVKICRSPADDAMPGWNVAGPLKTPLQLVSKNFSLEQLPKIGFFNNRDIYRDAAAFSLASEYYGDPDETGPFSFPIALAENQTCVLDFGKTIYAVPEIKINSCNRDDILDVITGEHLMGAEIIALENGTRRNISTIILHDLPDGAPPVNWVLNNCKGFRYIMLVARKARTVIAIQNVIAFVSTFEVDSRGTFECSDSKLNAIWDAGVRTLDTTMQGHFLDSPTKDQTQCLPDTMIQAFSSYVTHDGYNLSATALANFARTQTETGEINSLTPSSFFQAIPDFSLIWPIWLQKHLMTTGDKQLLQQLLPALNSLMEYYNSLAIEPNGPLPQLDDVLGNNPFLDLGEIDRQGISTGLNAIYCRALFSAAWIAEFANDPDLQNTYRLRAARIAQQIHNLNWDQSRMLFVDSYSNSQQSPFSSWQSNILAIYGGIATKEDFNPIWNQLFTTNEPYENFSQGDYNNPFFKYFILDDAFANGLSRWGINLIRYYWGKMIDAGATTLWELFDPDNPALAERICSHCQGYAVAPNAFLISEVAGIRIATPGMSAIFFQPCLDGFSWCRASIPTPQGKITLSWELDANDVLEITIQANYPLDVIPVLSPQYASKAIFHVSDTVSILAEESPEASAISNE
ncbi:MAG: hypothetical protein J6X55_01605 [Victivallales bacterium]|nr:hypothetical protein [Victivallales bacterium]